MNPLALWFTREGAPCQVGTRLVKLIGLSSKSTCNICCIWSSGWMFGLSIPARAYLFALNTWLKVPITLRAQPCMRNLFALNTWLKVPITLRAQPCTCNLFALNTWLKVPITLRAQPFCTLRLENSDWLDS